MTLVLSVQHGLIGSSPHGAAAFPLGVWLGSFVFCAFPAQWSCLILRSTLWVCVVIIMSVWQIRKPRFSELSGFPKVT